MRITFVISSLSCGGAEKVVCLLANCWIKKGYDISIITIGDPSPPFFYIDQNVKIVSIHGYKTSKNIFSAIFNNVKRIFRLRRQVIQEMPDYVISFMDRTNILTILALIGKRIPVVISERNNPAMNFQGHAWSWLRKCVYPMAEKIVLQCEGFKRYFPNQWDSKIAIIPNPIEEIQKINHSRGDKDRVNSPSIIAIGKLKRQKGFDILIQAFCSVHKIFPEWSLNIFGEGEERDALQNLILKYQFEKAVNLKGETSTPFHYLFQSNIFVLSSRFEGFPNVLCEAMACGLPVITTYCSPAVDDIVENNVNGIICDNDKFNLTNAIVSLINSPDLQQKIGENAKLISRKYSIDNITKKWEDVLKECVV